jgi:hypothetical protein
MAIIPIGIGRDRPWIKSADRIHSAPSLCRRLEDPADFGSADRWHASSQSSGFPMIDDATIYPDHSAESTH